MKKKLVLSLFSGWIILFIACSDSFEDDDNLLGPRDISLEDPINDFVWKGLNSWYYWQADSENLDDSKDDKLESYYEFLNQYDDNEQLMLELCYRHSRIVGSINAVDRFSWFVEDYEVQQQAFQGIRTRFGFTSRIVEIDPSSGTSIILILLVEPNSPADAANIQRGDIINAINGTILTSDNVDEAYKDFSNQSVTISFAKEQNGVLVQLPDKTISRDLVVSNPVYLKKIFNDIDGKKVGYLVYNQFSRSFNDELNNVFGDFKAEAIDELILDLRFNGGGSVQTSSYLASMIYAQAEKGLFADLVFNKKHSNEDDGYNLSNSLRKYNANGDALGQESINRLNSLDRLYVITSKGTASASELVINGLRPFMSSVKLVGTTTYGKNVGSITLYDSPKSDYTSESRANSSHKFAMQPIVFRTFNKNGESDYTQGFSPDIQIDESNYWNVILPLGDPNEALLKAALNDIRGIQAKDELSKMQLNAKFIETYLSENKFDQEMYIDD